MTCNYYELPKDADDMLFDDLKQEKELSELL
jgi:hypothetical protein